MNKGYAFVLSLAFALGGSLASRPSSAQLPPWVPRTGSCVYCKGYGPYTTCPGATGPQGGASSCSIDDNGDCTPIGTCLPAPDTGGGIGGGPCGGIGNCIP